MKKLFLFLIITAVAIVFVFIFIDVYESSTRQVIENDAQAVEKVVVQSLTSKQKLLDSLSLEEGLLISKIDSIEFLLAPTRFVHNRFSIEKKRGETWTVSIPYKNKWKDRIYNEESGELLKVLSNESYLGRAYLEKIHKRDVWTRYCSNGEKDYYIKNSFMEYGVLLSADTVAGKIFPAGTFVVSYFQGEDEYERGHIFYEYVEDYDVFREMAWRRLKAVYDWTDWVNGYYLEEMIIWL